jgi:hypothetical protein
MKWLTIILGICLIVVPFIFDIAERHQHSGPAWSWGW